jgi:hypothetical protein
MFVYGNDNFMVKPIAWTSEDSASFRVAIWPISSEPTLRAVFHVILCRNSQMNQVDFKEFQELGYDTKKSYLFGWHKLSIHAKDVPWYQDAKKFALSRMFAVYKEEWDKDRPLAVLKMATRAEWNAYLEKYTSLLNFTKSNIEESNLEGFDIHKFIEDSGIMHDEMEKCREEYWRLRGMVANLLSASGRANEQDAFYDEFPTPRKSIFKSRFNVRFGLSLNDESERS